jgi:putative nucleotidyltransferase with HDIG domain
MKDFFPQIRLSLRAKIVLPYLLLACGLAMGAAYIISQIVFDSIEERFLNQLVDAGKLTSEWMVREENRILSTVRYLANVEDVDSAIQQANAEQLRAVVYPIVFNAGESEAHILDGQGRALLSLYHPPGSPVENYEYSQGSEEFVQAEFVRAVIESRQDAIGDKFTGTFATVRGDFFYISGPIYDHQSQLVGVVLVGKEINQLVRQIREELLAQVTFYHLNGQVLGTTFLDNPILPAETAQTLLQNQGQQSLLRKIEVSNNTYREILGPWQVRGGQQIGLIGVSFAENFLVRLNENTWFKLLFFVLTAFVLVTLVGYLIAYRISQPILSLNDAATRVSHGDLNVHVSAWGNDEIAHLTQEFNAMVSNLQRSKIDLVAAYDKTLEGWAKALELRDGNTMGHSQRVTDLTLRLAQEMGIPQEQLIHIQRGALLHDIGKMAIPDYILLKPGPLTEEEWAIMRQHPTYAAEMLKGIPFLRPALDIPACHHEKWDGTGYPLGLKGEQIPLPARIFAVVDVWDALTSHRPYRKALSIEQTLDTLCQKSGSHFDPAVLDVFIRMTHYTHSSPNGN